MRPCAAAAAAGLLGAAAAGAAKLALGARLLSDGEEAGGWLLYTVPVLLSSYSEAVFMLPVLLRVGCIGLVCACNAVMWTIFAKALRLSSSSASASVTTTASNSICSAILGKLLFGETWTPLWWVGLTVTLCGLMLLHTAAPQPTHVVEKKGL